MFVSLALVVPLRWKKRQAGAIGFSSKRRRLPRLCRLDTCSVLNAFKLQYRPERDEQLKGSICSNVLTTFMNISLAAQGDGMPAGWVETMRCPFIGTDHTHSPRWTSTTFLLKLYLLEPIETPQSHCIFEALNTSL